jgi:hypothetical protein
LVVRFIGGSVENVLLIWSMVVGVVENFESRSGVREKRIQKGFGNDCEDYTNEKDVI